MKSSDLVEFHKLLIKVLFLGLVQLAHHIHLPLCVRNSFLHAHIEVKVLVELLDSLASLLVE